MKTEKIYILMANDEFYDAHDQLEAVQKWEQDFSSKIKTGKSPQRWFNRFLVDGKMTPVKLQILEVSLNKCKKI